MFGDSFFSGEFFSLRVAEREGKKGSGQAGKRGKCLSGKIVAFFDFYGGGGRVRGRLVEFGCWRRDKSGQLE